MGIRAFMFLLLLISSSLLVVTTVLTKQNKVKAKDLPEITFFNSTMYDINNKEVTQIITSKKAYHYPKEDKLFNATVILKSLDKSKKLITDVVNSKLIVITKELLKFRGDVKYNRNTTTTLNSESLDYNRITKNLVSNQKFTAFYNGSKVSGTSLSVNKNNVIFRSKDNTPVKLDIIMDTTKE